MASLAGSRSNGPEGVEESFLLPHGDVHVWTFDAAMATRAWDHLLSDDETEAAQHLTGASQVRFKNRRGALRLLLGRYLQKDPASLQFSRNQSGKPSLVTGDISFSISRSGDTCAIAMARHCEIGIDIERLREIDDRDSIAIKFFAPEEIHTLTKAAASEVDRLFLNVWTRKEAIAKASGLGVSHGLSILVPAQNRLQGFRVDTPELPFKHCYLYDLSLMPGIVATLASRAPVRSVAEKSLPN